MVRESDFVDECYADKDLSLLKKLTLVIPTYNRNYYLSRCLWYHAHFPFGEIIVADSSPEEKKVVNRETVTKVREMFGTNIRYLEYEPETEKYGRDIYRKWGDAVQHVETEYSQIVTDKEFTIPTTLNKGIMFLDGNPDYGSVDGKYYFAELDSNNKIKYTEGYKNERGWSTKCSLPFTNPIDRYLTASTRTNASTNLMSLRRADIHKEVYNNLIKYDIRDIRFGEFLPEFTTIIKAKHYYFADDFFNFRDTINATKGRKAILSESSCSRYPYFEQYIEDEVYDVYFKTAVNCLTDEMIKSGCNLKSDEIEEIINTTLPHALERRGYYSNSRSIRESFYYNYTKYCPKKIQTELINPILIKILNLDDNMKNKTDHIGDDLKIINKLIIDSNKYHQDDLPYITYNNR